MKNHSLANDRKAIGFHYDVSNQFYRLFLGETMTYSCAYFREESDSIDEAQTNKIDLICRKLRLKQGQRLLDIGCGWGALIIHAAKKYGVRCHGVTLSKQQYDYVWKRIEEEDLAEFCTVELKDYRQLKGENYYDKIVSVGMFEHVGIDYFRAYFQAARRLLKDKGLFLNHGITTCRTKILKSTGSKFMDTYIFPNAELINVGFIIQSMEENNFEILDVESLRRHYAKTLRLWAGNLKEQREKALTLVNEPIYRTWLLYMAGCAHAFETGKVNIYQILLTKRGNNVIPMTREDIYKWRI